MLHMAQRLTKLTLCLWLGYFVHFKLLSGTITLSAVFTRREPGSGEASKGEEDRTSEIKHLPLCNTKSNVPKASGKKINLQMSDGVCADAYCCLLGP